MATLPGVPFTPANYGTEVIVFSAAFGWEGVVDGAPPRETGRLFRVEPNKTKKVPVQVWNFIEAHYPYSDVVRVNQTETETGITFDLETAKKESLEKGAAADMAAFKAYISAAVEDFVKRNKPVPQPADNILRIIERRGYDLKKFGITPIGWEEPEKDKRLAALADENKGLKEQLDALSAKLDKLVKGK